MITILYDNADGITWPTGMTLTSDDYLLVCDRGNNCILKMHKSGMGSVDVIYDSDDWVNEPTAITVDNSTGVIYWCNSGTDQVMKGKSDGTLVPIAMYGGDDVIRNADGIAIDKGRGKIYLSDNNLGILVGNLDGSGTPNVLFNKSNYPAMGCPRCLVSNPETNTIYWIDMCGDEIISVYLSETSTPLVLYDRDDGVDGPQAISIDYQAGKIYWSEASINVIASGNLNGSGTREVLVDNTDAKAFVLDFK